MRWNFPVDHECPEVISYYEGFENDPMGEAMGAPMDEIYEGFNRRHMKGCVRCREFGAANIEVI